VGVALDQGNERVDTGLPEVLPGNPGALVVDLVV
jgi:hypothetical protein